MKKLLLTLIIFTLTLLLIACGGEEAVSENESSRHEAANSSEVESLEESSLEEISAEEFSQIEPVEEKYSIVARYNDGKIFLAKREGYQYSLYSLRNANGKVYLDWYEHYTINQLNDNIFQISKYIPETKQTFYGLLDINSDWIIPPDEYTHLTIAKDFLIVREKDTDLYKILDYDKNLLLTLGEKYKFIYIVDENKYWIRDITETTNGGHPHYLYEYFLLTYDPETKVFEYTPHPHDELVEAYSSEFEKLTNDFIELMRTSPSEDELKGILTEKLFESYLYVLKNGNNPDFSLREKAEDMVYFIKDGKNEFDEMFSFHVLYIEIEKGCRTEISFFMTSSEGYPSTQFGMTFISDGEGNFLVNSFGLYY